MITPTQTTPVSQAADSRESQARIPVVRSPSVVSFNQVPFSKPLLGDREVNAVSRALRSGWITQGPLVEQFEASVARYVGGGHGVATCNATAALHLAMHVLGIGPGDEVVVPSFTFIATANAVAHCGATPVFADVDAATFNIDPDSLSSVVTKRTKVVVVVHQFGLPADLERLSEVAASHGLMLIEDAACALGSRYDVKRIGGHSPMVCFSFHPRKVVTTGEGGMIVTRDRSLAERLRRLRHHGMDRSDWQRHRAPSFERESYSEIGFNYRMSDVAAAVGLAQMERIDTIVAARRRLARIYDHAFSEVKCIRLATCQGRAVSNAQSYAICLADDAPILRDALVSRLRARGIAAKAGPRAIHMEPCYRDRSDHADLPQSRRLSDSMILLPLFPTLSDDQQKQVVEAVLESLGRAPARAASRSAIGTLGA